MPMTNENKKSEEKGPAYLRDLSVEKLLKDIALYEPVLFNVNDAQTFFDFHGYNGTIDCHCTQCNKDSTFKGLTTIRHDEIAFNKKVKPGMTFELSLSCSRCPTHIFFSYWVVTGASLEYNLKREIDQKANDSQEKRIRTAASLGSGGGISKASKPLTQWLQLIKIGQWPSLADLSLPAAQQYREILGIRYNEYSKSIGLAAHGVGIGAFIYLRRIFESLIDEAAELCRSEDAWTSDIVDQFQRSRMGEKITLLKSHLPQFLVENCALYGILSKGVHELGEEECLKHYPVVKAGIELILDEKMTALKQKRKTEEARKQIRKLASGM